MSVNLTSLYAQQFATNVKWKLQQQGSRLRKCAMEGSYIGEQASPVDQVGKVEMQPVTTRFGAMGRVDAAVDRRWVQPSSFDLPQLIDSVDKLKMLTDPSSVYVQNAVMAAGRQMDRLILAAINGTALTGKTGSTATVLPAGQKVAVNFGAASNTGLTVAKLREAKRLLMAAEVDLETDQIWCAVKAKQHDNLLAEAQVISLDFNEKPVLMEGKITRFLGINFVHTELVETSTYDLVPVFAKSGVHLGIWNDIKTSISQRNDLQSEPWQAYVYMTAGATRIEEEKSVQVSCA